MHKIRHVFLTLSAISTFLVLCLPNSVYADSDEQNTYSDWIQAAKTTHDRTLTITPDNPQPGQQVLITLSEPANHLGNTVPVLFADASSPDDSSSWLLAQGTADPDSNLPHPPYQVVVPTTVKQGADYDVFVADTEGASLFVFKGTISIGPVPGHQLPETPYAILLPLLLIVGFAVFRLRKRVPPTGKA